jgi:hypothetical protein
LKLNRMTHSQWPFFHQIEGTAQNSATGWFDQIFLMESWFLLVNPNWKVKKCGHPHILDNDGKSCNDIDECLTGIHDCGRDECFNKYGGYGCSKETDFVIWT